MFRSLMTIIRELYLYLTKVIFMLKSFKFTLKYTIISLLHVSVFNDHHQGALSVSVTF